MNPGFPGGTEVRGSVELVVENSQLTPEDLGGFLPGSFTANRSESGDRGLWTDVLLGAVNGGSAAAVSSVVTALWLAYRGRRERDLRDTPPTTIRVSITGEGGSTVEATVDLHGDGADGARTVEADIERNGTSVVARAKITFPADS
jgi:hypothetical protein